jgi:hypothetical protein
LTTYFPQIAQFPGTKRVRRRTVGCEAPDGSVVKYADSGAREVEWELRFAGLTDGEWGAIRSLFEASEGRLQTFTFVDPFDNLLRSSEDLVAADWLKGAGLTVAAGVADPFGGTGATRVTNAGVEAGEIAQELPAPAAFVYSMSVYGRSEGESRISLFAEAGDTKVSKEFAIGPAWRRVVHSVQLGGAEERVRFGLSVRGGSWVELYGAQVEAQAGASAYKRSGAGGVYVNARFAEDVLTVNTDGPGLHSASVRIRTAG